MDQRFAYLLYARTFSASLNLLYAPAFLRQEVALEMVSFAEALKAKERFLYIFIK